METRRRRRSRGTPDSRRPGPRHTYLDRAMQARCDVGFAHPVTRIAADAPSLRCSADAVTRVDGAAPQHDVSRVRCSRSSLGAPDLLRGAPRVDTLAHRGSRRAPRGLGRCCSRVHVVGAAARCSPQPSGEQRLGSARVAACPRVRDDPLGDAPTRNAWHPGALRVHALRVRSTGRCSGAGVAHALGSRTLVDLLPSRGRRDRHRVEPALHDERDRDGGGERAVRTERGPATTLQGLPFGRC